MMTTIIKWINEGYRRFLRWDELRAIREGRAPSADVLPFPQKAEPREATPGAKDDDVT